MRLGTPRLNQVAAAMASLGKRAYALAEEISAAINGIEKEHKNIVAAHKAHTTMAKRGKGISPQRTQRAQRKAKAEKKKVIALGAGILNREGAKGAKGGKA